ncbi:MAG: metal ABC transporter permease [Candidatus Bathyarchaeia archaeon]
MIEILQYEFMRNALIAAFLVSLTCGIVGTYIVIKRIVFISGGISHAAFGGIGLGYLLRINPILAAIPFSILVALSIGTVSKKTKISEDTAIGILWALGMALGIIFITISPGYAPDLFSYLFGSILTVSLFDLIIMLILNIIIIFTVILFYKELLAISFDEEFSEVVGISTKSFYFMLICLVALSVVILIRVVGAILVIALLTIPAAISKQFTYNIKKLMVLSTFIGIILTVTGLYLSYIFDLPSGATIVLVSGVGLLFSSFLKHFISI